MRASVNSIASTADLADGCFTRQLFRPRSAVDAGRSGSILYVSAASSHSLAQERTAIAARWMLGLPPVVFGLAHFIGIRVFASIVPHWMGFGYFWAALTGLAFFLAAVRNLLGHHGCPGRQVACVDAVAV